MHFACPSPPELFQWLWLPYDSENYSEGGNQHRVPDDSEPEGVELPYFFTFSVQKTFFCNNNNDKIVIIRV
jgi:hypothetical protein